MSLQSEQRDRALPIHLAEVCPPMAGRWLLLCAAQNCPPCEDLKQALLVNELTSSVLAVAVLCPGDTKMRSAHLRVGSRTYPTVLLMNGDIIESEIGGCVSDDDGVNLSAFTAYLQG